MVVSTVVAGGVALLVFVTAGVGLAAVRVTAAENGLLDLRGVSFAEMSRPVRLEGERLFAWSKLNDAQAPLAAHPETIHVPGSWSAAGLSSSGFGTYRLRMLLPETSGDLVLQMPQVHTACRVFANGDEIGRRVTACLRPSDIAGRYGGEDIVVMLSDAGIKDAEHVAERVRQVCRERPVVEFPAHHLSRQVSEHLRVDFSDGMARLYSTA